jgi:hypothetical protein
LPPLEVDWRQIWIWNRFEPTLFALILASQYLFPLIGLDYRSFAWDTTFLMVLWLGCGWRLLRRQEDEVASAAAEPAPAAGDRASPLPLRRTEAAFPA